MVVSNVKDVNAKTLNKVNTPMIGTPLDTFGRPKIEFRKKFENAQNE